MVDASVRGNYDPLGLGPSVERDAVSSTQEPLRSLALDTGGRALLNTNSLGPAVSRALKETSAYYLLAWRPEAVAAAARRSSGGFRRACAGVRN
jgi:hypothetical protein